MSDYVTVILSTEAYWQPPFRSVGNGCLIGNGGGSVPESFWLRRPNGSIYDAIAAGSDLKNGLDAWFSQRNAERVLCINTGSVNAASVLDQVPRPLPDGSQTTFFVAANPVQSIDAVTIIRNTTEYDLPEGGYSYVALQSGGEYTGQVTITPAPERGDIIYVDYTVDALSNAFRLSMTEDVQFVVLCNETNLTNLDYLQRHVDLAFASIRFRMGVAMLPQSQTLTGTYRNWPQTLSSDYMILVAHNSSDDAAAAFAGVLSGMRVFDDPILAPVNIDYTGTFTDNDHLAFQQNQVVCIDRYFSNELGLRALRNFTLSGTSDRKYIDFVRTYQDLMWRLISTLDSPNVIGKINYTSTGMANLRERIYSAFRIPIEIGEIVDLIGIDIPLEEIIETPYAQRDSADRIVLQLAKAQRRLDNITVTYEAQSWVNDLNLILQVV